MGVVMRTFLIFLSLQTKGVLLVDILSDSCGTHSNCGECIREPDICVWCAMDNYQGSRCMKYDTYKEDTKKCSNLLQNPVNNINISRDAKFSSDLEKFTQIRPQEYKIDLRVGVPVNFTFSYKPASDYPVDLYFLLDTSVTMENVRETIEEQSKNIYNTMQNLTKNVQFGIGAFVDKNALPYTNETNSERTYSFRNRLKLTNDSDLFKKTIQDTKFGYNYDPPEGGLDALAQVLKCDKQIGWRSESRKMVVFLTDATYHVAGDGMIGGIFAPYDGGCYTNDEGVYTNELLMDYPSASILNKLATDKEITVIFLVKNIVKNIYSHLSEAISGSQCESYDSGSDNSGIGRILTEKYKDITRSIKLKANFKPGSRDKFNIKFNPDCTTDVSSNDPKCGVKEGEEIKITGTLELFSDYKTDNTIVEVLIEGISEKLTINVNIMRHCECENNAKLDSVNCSNGGTFICGTCECNKNRYGEKCACVANGKRGFNDTSTCIMPGDEDPCHGHGICICGKCDCGKDTPYEGPYCQFNKDNCPRYNNTVCNGRGSCLNEQCKCSDDAWEGDACECPKSNSPCKINDKVCNNMGQCRCGKCVCNPTAAWDVRTKDGFCRMLPCHDSHKPQCDRLSSCAQCLHSGEDCPECLPFKASLTEYLQLSDYSWQVCPDISVKVGCYTRYMYRYSENEYRIELIVQAKENCLASYYMYGGACLVSLILIGVLTLVGWKILTYTRDRREYERFIREHAEDGTQVCDNPTYRAASTTIANPVFRRPSNY